MSAAIHTSMINSKFKTKNPAQKRENKQHLQTLEKLSCEYLLTAVYKLPQLSNFFLWVYIDFVMTLLLFITYEEYSMKASENVTRKQR